MDTIGGSGCNLTRHYEMKNELIDAGVTPSQIHRLNDTAGYVPVPVLKDGVKKLK
jgi:hypothetical protein